jgi:hypothetical protein
VLDNSTPDEVLGIVVGYDADFRNGHAKVGAARFTDGTAHSLQFVRGAFLFFEYLFRGFPFRKLYLEVPEYNLAQFASGLDSLFELEGSLRAHTWFDDRYWDLHFLALSRDRWRTESTRRARFIGLDLSGPT